MRTSVCMCVCVWRKRQANEVILTAPLVTLQSIWHQILRVNMDLDMNMKE